MLTGFLLEDDPLRSMLEWLVGELMRVEAEAKVGAEKHKHSQERGDLFFRLQGQEAQLSGGDVVSSGAQGEEGWIHTIFCDREEMQRGSVAESGTGGFSKRGIYEEDRTSG